MRTNSISRILFSLLAVSLFVFVSLAFAQPTHAAVSSWQQGMSVVPQSTTDFSSDAFKQSLDKLKATGASHVAFIIPFYQSNIGSTDVQAGWNTPTDASLAAGIAYAKSLGLKVTLKPHIETYTGTWRAMINPSNRAEWFTNYGNFILKWATIAEQQGADMVVLGTELVSMAASNMNSTNTHNWQTLIGKVRQVYSGKLTYSANSNSNNNDTFINEKKFIGFWGSLDYAGLSTYYELNSDGSVQGLKNAWDFWNNSDLRGFQQSVGKPLLFLEVGYRSIDGSYIDPWNWSRGGNYNASAQANAYEALMTYWNDYSYMQGVYLWYWEPNPGAGGQGNTNYTPQNKPAQDVLTKWFTNPETPIPPSQQQPQFTLTGSASPNNPNNGSSVGLSATVKSVGGPLSNGIVDIEVYNSSNQKVFQKFFENQTLGLGATQNFTASWTPNSAGSYRMTIGVFSSGWRENHGWNDSAAQITVGAGSTPPPPPPSGTTTPPQPPPPPAGTTIDIWWPSNGASISGVQPFKGLVQERALNQYQLFWQVDGGGLVQMFDSNEDYPHKEALVDVSGWNWRGTGPYQLNFVAKDINGSTIGQKGVSITVAR